MRDQSLHRRHVLALLGLVSIASLAAGAREDEKHRIYTVLDVEVFSNLDRPISDIMFNGTDLGVTNKYGGTGLITDVRIPSAPTRSPGRWAGRKACREMVNT